MFGEKPTDYAHFGTFLEITGIQLFSRLLDSFTLARMTLCNVSGEKCCVNAICFPPMLVEKWLFLREQKSLYYKKIKSFLSAMRVGYAGGYYRQAVYLLRCVHNSAIAQYHQTICAVKSHSRALATFQTSHPISTANILNRLKSFRLCAHKVAQLQAHKSKHFLSEKFSWREHRRQDTHVNISQVLDQKCILKETQNTC